MSKLKNKKINPNTEGSTLLLMTLVILAAMLIISLSVAAITTNGLRAGITQVQSTKAYFAAEAGAERILWEFRKKNNDPNFYPDDSVISPCNHNNICFDSYFEGQIDSCDSICSYDRQELENNSFYRIQYFFSDPDTTLKAYGSFNDINRVIELGY